MIASVAVAALLLLQTSPQEKNPGLATLTTQTIATGQGEVLCLAFSPDGKTLASGGRAGNIKLWDLASRELRLQINAYVSSRSGPVFSLAYTPKGDALVSGGQDTTNSRNIRFWDPANGKELRGWQGHDGATRCVAFPHDGKVLVTSGEDGTIRVWDPSSEKELRALKGHDGIIRSFALSPSGRLMVSGGHDSALVLWDFGAGKELWREEWKDGAGTRLQIWSVAFSPDEKTVAMGGQGFELLLKDARTHRVATRFQAGGGLLWPGGFSPDGKYLLSGGQTVNCRLWNVAKAQSTFAFPASPTNNSYSTAICSPDGRTAAAANGDGTIHLAAMGK